MYPTIEGFAELHPEVTVLMVSNGSEEENRELGVREGFSFPILQWRDDVANQYEVPGVPFFYAIDEQGVIMSAGFASTLAQLENLVGGYTE